MENITLRQKKITGEIVAAYSQCQRKAFLLLCTDKREEIHEYMRIIRERKEANQNKYIRTLQEAGYSFQTGSISDSNFDSDYFANSTITCGHLKATYDLLKKIENNMPSEKDFYEPIIFVGTHNIEKEDKLKLYFAAHVLEKAQGQQLVKGTIITIGQKLHTLKLTETKKKLYHFIEELLEWKKLPTVEPPALILNKHCPLCEFQYLCTAQAKQEDSLSLLHGISKLKTVQKYERKGIFTVKQLSYLFKPRKRRKDAKKSPTINHQVELQALAIRTQKIYLQEIPEIPQYPLELILDIEGVAERQEYYLIGLLICEKEKLTYYSFWSDESENESDIWQQFLEKLSHYPNGPIYHYGSYEKKAIEKLGKRYSVNVEGIQKRLVNVNEMIFGKVYFPVFSNSLKEIGEFLGASWTEPNACGLQSLIWRFYWEKTHDNDYRKTLLTYNEEDCRAVRILVDELSEIKDREDSITCFAFTRRTGRHAPKRGLTKDDNPLHKELSTMLQFSYTDYDKKKICFRHDQNTEKNLAHTATKKRRSKKKLRATKIVDIPKDKFCHKHRDIQLEPTEVFSKRTILDLVLSKNGIKKTITKYIGHHGYCSKCHRSYAPLGIRKYGANRLYGEGLKAWYIFQRVALRLPYGSISEMIKEQFDEDVDVTMGSRFVKEVALNNIETETIITKRLLDGPIVHADETPISIYGVTYYVWVFTNGKHAIFKLTKTREATIAHELLDNYHGVLISDFYSGYDSVKCKQQKCWVHLIRDLNNTLWQNPFDSEFEQFVTEVKNLIVPIMETIQKYGLKQRNLNKFRKQVNKFYETSITSKLYKSEHAQKFQKRIKKYRESLFMFLEQDGIPWHNNTAESAIRHLAKQREISGTFGETTTGYYLMLLGIKKTCQFQKKSFLKFLLSDEKDVDLFKK